MRIIKTFFSSIMLAAILTSCGKSDNNSLPQDATPTPQSTSVADKMGDAAEDIVDGAENQVNDMTDTTKKVVDDVVR